MDWEERYSRQLMLEQWGEEGQRKLSEARILLVGVGGLGSPIATYLCAAGVGQLGIVDADSVSESNLQRQVLYEESQVGQSKVECARQRLERLNSNVKIVVYDCFLDSSNADSIISEYDMVVDGCDNFATRFLLNDTCLKLGKPYIYGSICGLRGQVSVFSYPCEDGRIHSYRELYDESEVLSMPHPGKAVLGVTPAVTGSVEASQALMIASGGKPSLAGHLWCIDLESMESYKIEL